MLDAIRTILQGHVDAENTSTEVVDGLKSFCEIAHDRWLTLIADEAPNSPARLPEGYYEMGFSLVGVPPLKKLNDLRTRLREAGRISLTGWPPFLELDVRGWAANVFEGYVEAWTSPCG